MAKHLLWWVFIIFNALCDIMQNLYLHNFFTPSSCHGICYLSKCKFRFNDFSSFYNLSSTIWSLWIILHPLDGKFMILFLLVVIICLNFYYFFFFFSSIFFCFKFHQFLNSQIIIIFEKKLRGWKRKRSTIITHIWTLNGSKMLRCLF